MTPIPGIIMRLSASPDSPDDICPRTTTTDAVYRFRAGDELAPEFNTIYFLSDITPLQTTTTPYDRDVATNSGTSITWVLASFINGRDPSSDSAPTGKVTLPAPPPSTTPHVLPRGAPFPGSVLVANGGTPRPDKEDDYHGWYDEEHGPLLTGVEGWEAGRRYKLERVFGGSGGEGVPAVETANFYGLNFYAEENGLGGPVWKEAVATEWTKRIRGNRAKHNIRRIWRAM